MFEGWELQIAYRVGELIKGVGNLIMEWATKKQRLLERDRRRDQKRADLPTIKPE